MYLTEENRNLCLNFTFKNVCILVEFWNRNVSCLMGPIIIGTIEENISCNKFWKEQSTLKYTMSDNLGNHKEVVILKLFSFIHLFKTIFKMTSESTKCCSSAIQV